MGLMQQITKENTQDETVAKTIDMMERAVGAVPDTLRFFGNSPGLFGVLTAQIGYYQNHPNLGPELLALIRYTAACHFDNTPCIRFNGDLLRRQGMTEQELAGVLEDPDSAPLETKDRALLTFVYNGVRDQDSASEEKMVTLRSMGWKDSDILDAVNHGFFMYAPGKILRLFRM